jgi:hypothetical protein
MGSKVVDIKSWRLDPAADLAGIPCTADSGMVDAGPVSLSGYWWDDTVALCMACRDGVPDITDQTAVASTKDEPSEFIGVLCVACTKALMKNGSITLLRR